MKEITEDYVSFEIAKLLKEKGFNEKCFRTYFNDGIISRIFDDNDEIYNENLLPSVVAAPTLQMAMKWLREVHKCYIHIAPFYQDLNYSKPPKWLVAVDAKGRPFPTINRRFETYEEACEAAIKYCLENLI